MSTNDRSTRTTAWVVGGASGIGAAVSRLFRDEGVDTTVLDLAGSDGVDQVLDLADRAGVERAVAQLAASTGWPDRLVVTAGVTSSTSIAELDLDRWDHLVAVNLTGPALLLHLILPHLVERGSGRVVLFASGTAVRPGVGTAAYASSKAGLIALAKVAAIEAAPYGPTVNVIAPGLTDTPMMQPYFEGRAQLDAAARESSIANPQGYALDAEDLAAAVSFLCGPGSTRITGQVIHVNGGAIMYG